jgi:DNA processing protein
MHADDIAGEEFEAWFRLLGSVGRGPARRLLAACGSAPAVFATRAAALREIAGARAAEALAKPPEQHAEWLAAARAWLAGGDETGAPRQVLTIADPGYPAALLQTADPPLLLYVHGDASRLAAPMLAMVGSRHPTAQGADNARAFAAALARSGWTIVSGMARGIDAASHEGALAAGPGGAGTVAVVGTGPDIVYPPAHRALARRILRHGVIVSELAPGTPALKENFPQRNRIIAGLAAGTLVVEAAVRSGSLITARLAAEAGREVFAIPGSIHSPQSRGCHALLKQGAKLVETAEDVAEELRGAGAGVRQASLPLAAAPAHSDAPTSEDPLLAAIGHDPVTLDALLARTGETVQRLSARLLDLELEGRIARLPGGLYQRRDSA